MFLRIILEIMHNKIAKHKLGHACMNKGYIYQNNYTQQKGWEVEN